MALFGKKKGPDSLPPFGPPGDPYGAPPGMDPYGQPQGFPQQQQQAPPMPFPDMGQQGQDSYGNPPMEQFQPQAQASDYGGGGDDMRGRVEEVAEAIIDEKWNELMKDMNKVIEWKERSDTELKRLAQEIVNLKERFEGLHKGILGKISEYDTNLKSVGSEIKAMEMTFQKILPTFTDNVNKLERYTNKMG
ncbi:MAG: hypothetical protein Q7S65_05150 [Nanoarchaeota archaeon]|nr:hypothetical protein [Nanoarchaeota archaeon]